jgi:23S rRNA (uracil1939-C5)-methyltransferase
MPVKKGQLIELEIEDIAFGGKGFAKVDGMAVFVDQAVPLDRVAARIVKKKRTFAEARVVELLRPSPLRVPAPCPHSGVCGGCKWQFLDYEQQKKYKRRHVAESIEHIGLLQGVPVHPILPSDKVFGYRNKMEFSCSDRRWLLPHEMEDPEADRGFALGLHVPGTFYKVLDTRTCLLMPERGNAILDDIRNYIRASSEPVYGLRSHVGFWRFVMLRHSADRDQWMVNLITAAEKPEVVQPLADRLQQQYPEIISIVNNITTSKAGIAVGEYEIPLSGPRTITDRIGPYQFEISSNSFFQTNTAGAQKLYETVDRFAALSGQETVLDLYSGTGTIALFLSDSAREVTGLEIAESAVQDARRNCRRNRVENCRFVAGDVRDSLAAITATPDVLVIDPPRAGMHKAVLQQVMALAAPRLVYVSCNPATLARDLCILKEKYAVAEVQPVDMFPHTYHIESVARLEKIAV